MGKSTRWLLSLLGLKKSSKSRGNEKEKKPSAAKPEEARKSTKEKRRWSFGKAQESFEYSGSKPDYEQEQTKHAIAVAAASAAAAEAAVAAAQAAAAVVRLTTQNNNNSTPVFELISREEWAAVRIQTAFRGYLARRALRALKAVVRIQALFRGHRVRKQAAITLRCMQALVRVQARVRARRVRMSQEGLAVQQQLLQRRLKDQGRSRKSVDGWIGTTGTIEDLNAKNERKFQGAMKRERALAYALSKSTKQGATTGMVIDCEPDTPHWGWSWLERWMAARPWETPFDGLAEQTSPASGSTKIVEMDSGRPNIKQQQQRVKQKKNSVFESSSTPESKQQQPSSASSAATGSHQLPQFASHPAAAAHHQQQHHHPRSSDNLETEEYPGMSMPTPAGLSRDLVTEDEATNVKSSPAYSLKPLKQQQHQEHIQHHAREESDVFPSFPSYMATTQSSKAKVRSHSTPKQRPEGWNMPETPRSSSRRSSIPLQVFHGGLESRSTNDAAPIRRAMGLRSAGGSVVFDRSIASLRDFSINGDLRKPFRF